MAAALTEMAPPATSRRYGEPAPNNNRALRFSHLRPWVFDPFVLLASEREDPLSGPVEPTARAVIGDELRNPIAWCELTPCISWHDDPAALGEADIRARAIGSGWRVDALGRLVCLDCQRRDSRFRATHPVVAWDRRAAVTRAALLAAAWEEEQSPVNALPDATDVIPALPAAVRSSYPEFHAGSRARQHPSANGQPHVPAHALRGRHRRRA
jgi:hypothetical protein